jgi:hypothetical protein
MRKSKGDSFVFICSYMVVFLACKSSSDGNTLFPPSECDPFPKVFWSKNVKYFTANNNHGDTTFFDIYGNIVREVLEGRQSRQWAYDKNRNIIQEWKVEENGITNALYYYYLIDSTAVVQKRVPLLTDNWNYELSDLSTKYSFDVYILGQNGEVVKEINNIDNTHVFYSYNDSNLLGALDYLNCGQFQVLFEYSYTNNQLRRILTYVGKERTLSTIDYFESGLLDSTQHIRQGGTTQTDVYRYVFY